MGEVMTRGIINMPLEMVMGSINGIENYHSTAQSLLADYDALRAENIGMVAQRMAYAGEFPPDQDGLPDTGSIHQNIRKLKAENAELVAALVDFAELDISGADDRVARILISLHQDKAKAALAKHRGDK